MQPIIQTQIKFITQAQSEYAEAIAQQSPKAVEFWLSQLHRLCQQLYWLQQSAGPPFMVSKMPSGVTREQLDKLISEHQSMPVVVELKHKEPPLPTSYNWNDGFQGVTLSDSWDKEES